MSQQRNSFQKISGVCAANRRREAKQQFHAFPKKNFVGDVKTFYGIKQTRKKKAKAAKTTIPREKVNTIGRTKPKSGEFLPPFPGQQQLKTRIL